MNPCLYIFKNLLRPQTYLLLFILVCISLKVTAQSVSIENYSALSTGTMPSVMGLVRLTNASQWHGEVRYNYDDARSVSLYGGKTFSTRVGVPVTLTPMAGVIQREGTMGLLGINVESSARRFEISLQTTYIYQPGRSDRQQLATWSELSYSMNDWSFTGLTLQHAGLRLNSSTYDPGVLVGVQFRHWTIPVYGFNLFNNSRFLMIGVNWEFRRNKSNIENGLKRAQDVVAEW